MTVLVQRTDTPAMPWVVWLGAVCGAGGLAVEVSLKLVHRQAARAALDRP